MTYIKNNMKFLNTNLKYKLKVMNIKFSCKSNNYSN